MNINNQCKKMCPGLLLEKSNKLNYSSALSQSSLPHPTPKKVLKTAKLLQSSHLVKACRKTKSSGQKGIFPHHAKSARKLSNPTILSPNGICIAIFEMHFPSGRGLNQPMCTQAIYRPATSVWPASPPFVNVEQYFEV